MPLFGKSNKKKTSVKNVGLDIGTYAIKMARLSVSDEETRLENFASRNIKPDATDETRIATIKELWSNSGIPEKEVVTSISGRAVITRFIEMPKMAKEELANAVRFECEKYIPFNIDEVILDHQILESVQEGNKMRVLRAAAKKDIITHRIEMLKKAELEIKAMDVDAFALANAFFNKRQLEPEKTYALINFGSKYTDIDILKGPTICFTRCIQIGGLDFAKTIEEKLSISQKEAYDFKHQSKEKAEQINELVRPVVESLIEEIRLSFGYYENQFGKSIDEIWASGGECGLPLLGELMENSFGTNFKIWNPTELLKPADNINAEELKSHQNHLAISVGLALRG